jgi:hypothetical protein
MDGKHPTHALREAMPILLYATLLLADPERWTKHSCARDRNGDPVRADADTAVSWSANGAILCGHSSLWPNTPVRYARDSTGSIAAVRGPRWLVLTLVELGRSLLLAASQAPNQTRPGELGGALSKLLEDVDPTLIATAMNDLPFIDHRALMAAFDRTAEAIHEELVDRA